MAIAVEYNELALEWKPIGKRDHQFSLIAGVCLLLFITIGWWLSSVDVPDEPRVKEPAIPKRIAEFILEREKQKPKAEIKPKPVEPIKPKPKPVEEVKPKVTKKREVKSDKPLNETQKKAREKAQDSGLLALTSELADLVDTSNIDSMVGSKIASNKGSQTQRAQLDSSVLSKNAAKGSGGVNSADYGDSRIASTSLKTQELIKINQRLLAEQSATDSEGGSEAGEESGNYRSEEEVSLVFDQNKSRLYSIYNRERRKSPGLKGKIILEITINPNGEVDSIKIVSSELNNPALESRLVARIKMFKFSSDKSEPITITYPIEFLPS